MTSHTQYIEHDDEYSNEGRVQTTPLTKSCSKAEYFLNNELDRYVLYKYSEAGHFVFEKDRTGRLDAGDDVLVYVNPGSLKGLPIFPTGIYSLRTINPFCIEEYIGSCGPDSFNNKAICSEATYYLCELNPYLIEECEGDRVMTIYNITN